MLAHYIQRLLNHQLNLLSIYRLHKHTKVIATFCLACLRRKRLFPCAVTSVTFYIFPTDFPVGKLKLIDVTFNFEAIAVLF